MAEAFILSALEVFNSLIDGLIFVTKVAVGCGVWELLAKGRKKS
jgi:hypothetical protein